MLSFRQFSYTRGEAEGQSVSRGARQLEEEWRNGLCQFPMRAGRRSAMEANSGCNKLDHIISLCLMSGVG